MLTDYISASAVAEIGSTVSHVFGVPLVIAKLDGSILFVSDDWPSPKDLPVPEVVKNLITISLVSDKPVVGSLSEETVGLIPIRYDSVDCACGIVHLPATLPVLEERTQQFLQTLEKALGDISIYAIWAKNKHFMDVKGEAKNYRRQFQMGTAPHKEILKGLLDTIVKLGYDTVFLSFADSNLKGLTTAYVAGDESLIPKCIDKCGLGLWCLRVKEPVFVKNPGNDPRCSGGSSEIQTMACWPIFLNENSYAVLFLASRKIKIIEPIQQDFLDALSVYISFALDISNRKRETDKYSRRINAFCEISGVLNSTFDLATVLNLIVDMSATLFNVDRCCVYLKDEFSDEMKLMVAGGLTSGEVSFLAKRFEDRGSSKSTDFGLLDFPIQAKGKEIGYLSIGGFRDGLLSPEDKEVIKTFTNITGVAIENSRIVQNTQRTLSETISALSLAIEARDKTTVGHSAKVRELAVALAKAAGLSESYISTLESASFLHDIGKLGIPESTLNKTGSLSAQEYEDFKRHPVIGAEILSVVSSFGLLSDIVKHHHERFDGSGYPDGLKGDNIPIGARILAIADTFASLISKRSYRFAKDPFEALEMIRANAGKQFDPDLVESLEKVIRRKYLLNVEIDKPHQEGFKQHIQLVPSDMGLTDREAEILCHIAAGMNNKEIAAALYLSEKTVKTHVTHILKKLNLPDRTKAAIYAIQKGLIKSAL